jgi:flagellar basal-body rod modification protein FlgD
MKYQDPLDPSSSQDYIAQLAQFSQLDQLESMKTSLSMGEAASMIGKTVKGTTTAGATLEGTVKSIQNDSNGVVLVLADGEISLDKVTQVSA